MRATLQFKVQIGSSLSSSLLVSVRAPLLLHMWGTALQQGRGAQVCGVSAVCLSPASQELREAMFVGGNLMKGCFVISKEKKVTV